MFKMKFLFVFLFTICLTSGVFALQWNVCIDKFAPNAPSGLVASDNVVLSWTEATDEPVSNPDCTFGVDYYAVYLDGKIISQVSDTSYSGGALADGTYIFEVSAVDRAGNVGERVALEVTFPLDRSGANGGNSGSGSSSSSGGSGSGGSSESVGVNKSSTSNYSNSNWSSDAGFSSAGIDESDKYNSLMTGAVVGANGQGAFWGILILILLVILAYFYAKDRGAVPKSSTKAKKR